MKPVRIDCQHEGWKAQLKESLQQAQEVQLVNFSYTLDGQFCETLAFSHSMRFELDAKNQIGFFRAK
jgi:hypothetical protein